MAANYTDPKLDDDYMVGPTSEFRIKTQIGLLSILLISSIIDNGVMLILFARFKSLRRLSNYFLIDLTIVELLDSVVNIPIFMEFFLLTKKKNLERQTRWYAMLFHRYFLLNDLFSQIFQIVDCFLAIKYGRQFTSKKSSTNVKVFIASKWVILLTLLLAFMIPSFTLEEEHVSDEAYQRLLFGPNQVIWKIVIPSCQAFSVVAILLTNRLIKNSRKLVNKRHGMRIHGKGSKNSSKAVNTLTLIMVVQTLCKVPAAIYSYVAVDDRIEGNRWFAFFSYFFFFLSSSVMPLIYFRRTMAFRRALRQFRKHPLARNAYLDYAAQHGLTAYRNGRLHLDPKVMKRNERASPRSKGGYFTGAELPTKETDLSSRTTTQNSRPLSVATEASFLELPMRFGDTLQLELTDLQLKRKRGSLSSHDLDDGIEEDELKHVDTTQAVKMGDIKIMPSSPSTASAIEGAHELRGGTEEDDLKYEDNIQAVKMGDIKIMPSSLSTASAIEGAHELRGGTEEDDLKNEDNIQAVKMGDIKIMPSSLSTASAIEGVKCLQPEEEQSCSKEIKASANEKIKEHEGVSIEANNPHKLILNSEKRLVDAPRTSLDVQSSRYSLDKTHVVSKAKIKNEESKPSDKEKVVQLEAKEVMPPSEKGEFSSQKADQLPSQKTQSQEVQLPKEKAQLMKLSREEDEFPSLPDQTEDPQSKKEVQLPREERASQLETQKVKPPSEDEFPSQKFHLPDQTEDLPSNKEVQLPREEKAAQPETQKVKPPSEDEFPSLKVGLGQKVLSNVAELSSQEVGLPTEEGNLPSKAVEGKEKCFVEIEVKAMVHWDGGSKTKAKETTAKKEDDVSFDTRL